MYYYESFQIDKRSQYNNSNDRARGGLLEELRDALQLSLSSSSELTQQQRTRRIKYLNFLARGWDMRPEHSFLIDFIANSSDLRSFDMRLENSPNRTVHFEFLEACLEAATSNTSITNIIFSMWTHHDDGVPLGGGVARSLDALLKGRITQINIHQTGELDTDESRVLGNKIASLDKLEKLVLGHSRNEFLQGLLIALSKKEESPATLKQLVLHYPEAPVGVSVTLSGIDVFLASSGANALEDLYLSLHDFESEAMETLLRGLTNNAGIKRFDFDSTEISPEASHALANYILQTPPSLVELRLSVCWELNPNIQDVILPPLYRNSTIQRISLSGLIDHSNENNVKELLLHNSNIKALTCIEADHDVDITIDDNWMRSTADGLSQNSTLESLEIYFGGEQRVLNVAPIFQALPARPVGLRKLVVWGSTNRFGRDCAIPIAAVLQSTLCQLKELQLNFQWEDDWAIMTIISAAQKNRYLKNFYIRACGELSWGTWSAIASIIPKLKLSEFSVIAEGDDEEGVIAMEQTQKELLGALAINQTLCLARFEFDQPHDMGESFSAALKRYCLRNMAIATSNGLKKDVNVGGLPLAILPHVLQSLSRQSKSAEQRQQLCNTVVFSLLKSGRLSSEEWKSIKCACGPCWAIDGSGKTYRPTQGS